MSKISNHPSMIGTVIFSKDQVVIITLDLKIIHYSTVSESITYEINLANLLNFPDFSEENWKIANLHASSLPSSEESILVYFRQDKLGTSISYLVELSLVSESIIIRQKPKTLGGEPFILTGGFLRSLNGKLYCGYLNEISFIRYTNPHELEKCDIIKELDIPIKWIPNDQKNQIIAIMLENSVWEDDLKFVVNTYDLSSGGSLISSTAAIYGGPLNDLYATESGKVFHDINPTDSEQIFFSVTSDKEQLTISRFGIPSEDTEIIRPLTITTPIQTSEVNTPKIRAGLVYSSRSAHSPISVLPLNENETLCVFPNGLLYKVDFSTFSISKVTSFESIQIVRVWSCQNKAVFQTLDSGWLIFNLDEVEQLVIDP